MWRTIAAALLALGIALCAQAQTFVGAMSGSWWDASRPGEGQFITFETVGGRNVAYVAYFTYTPEGRATWHVGNADFVPGAASITVPLVTGSGAQFGSSFKSADVRTTSAGTATLETLRRARALEALRAIRFDAKRRGIDRMSAKAIGEVVAKARRARSRRVA